MTDIAAGLLHLTGRDPRPAPESLLGDLVPPPQFMGVSFDSYVPDDAYPSQTAALAAVEAKAAALTGTGKRGLFGRHKPDAHLGLYLDGGFGVGKTHLLAALFNAVASTPDPVPAAYGTFVEYTNLVGALGFAEASARLQTKRLVCIDEFELDDPGDTLIMARLLRELTEAGVSVVATSNTLPAALGEGRFAASEFLREIQGLAARFTVLRIDGEDYRHRDAVAAPKPLSENEFSLWAAGPAGSSSGGVAVDSFDDVVAMLPKVHPSRFGALLDEAARDGMTAVGWRDVHPITDQHAALRLVVLVDRLYDRQVPVRVTGVGVGEIFPPELLNSGYRKKYLRALSRITALAEPALASPAP